MFLLRPTTRPCRRLVEAAITFGHPRPTRRMGRHREVVRCELQTCHYPVFRSAARNVTGTSRKPLI